MLGKRPFPDTCVRVPNLTSGRQRLSRKGVENPGCLTTPARPFLVRPKSDADPGQVPNEDDLLTPESANLTGALIEYTWASMCGQILRRHTRTRARLAATTGPECPADAVASTTTSLRREARPGEPCGVVDRSALSGS